MIASFNPEGPGPINWFHFGDPHQPPYVAMAINFVILLAIYYRFGKKPVADALVARRDEIAKEIEDAHRMRAEAEARAIHYQGKLASLEQELANARHALVDAGEGERARAVSEAEERAARMKRDTETLIEQELHQLRADIHRETVNLAIQQAEAIVKNSITSADQARLIDDVIATLPMKHKRLQGDAQ